MTEERRTRISLTVVAAVRATAVMATGCGLVLIGPSHSDDEHLTSVVVETGWGSPWLTRMWLDRFGR